MLREWIKQKLEEKNQQICPANLWNDIAAAKDERLARYESQKRKSHGEANEHDAKKAKSATTLDSMVSSIIGASPPKTSAPQGVPVSKSSAPEGARESTPKAAAAKPAPPSKAKPPKATESQAQLKDMLKAWTE